MKEQLVKVDMAFFLFLQLVFIAYVVASHYYPTNCPGISSDLCPATQTETQLFCQCTLYSDEDEKEIIDLYELIAQRLSFHCKRHVYNDCSDIIEANKDIFTDSIPMHSRDALFLIVVWSRKLYDHEFVTARNRLLSVIKWYNGAFAYHVKTIVIDPLCPDLADLIMPLRNIVGLYVVPFTTLILLKS